MYLSIFGETDSCIQETFSQPLICKPALEKGLVSHMPHYFWANIHESESHWEVQISS